MKSVQSIHQCESVVQTTYDIITKEHNGTIKVESKEGEGTTFIIQLPVA